MRQTCVAQSTFNYTCSPIHKPCISSDLLTPQERLTDQCQIWPGNTQGSRFSQLALCIKLKRANIVCFDVSEMLTYKI